MKERSPVKKNILKLIPYIEIIAGVIFLCLEIHDYRTLYSMAEADAMYGGLADFCKYKENVFCPAFFWIIVILTGLSYWKNKKIYWILTQALVFMVFFRAMFPFYAIFIELNPVVFYILPLLYSTIFFVVVDVSEANVGIAAIVMQQFIACLQGGSGCRSHRAR